MKSVMILGAGIMQIPAVLRAKEMGLHVIASDKNPDAAGFKHADVPLVLDIKDHAGHVAFARENAARYGIAGVFAGADVAVTAAHVSEALGLPGISVETALRSNNKALMKRRWLEDGIATPYAEEAATADQAVRAARKIGFPLIVKAVDNAASRGSRKVAGVEEVPAAFAEAARFSTTRTALVEELASGPEQSVETIVCDGVHHRFGVVDRHFGFDPFPIETGHTNPSELPGDTQEQLYALTRRAADSLGIAWGPAKADTVLTTKGPMIFELPARLSGGFHSQYTTPLATGQDPLGAALALAIGAPFPLNAEQTRSGRAAVCLALFPQPGRIVGIGGIERARGIPGVAEIFVTAEVGDVIRPYRNCADRVCYIIAVGDTPVAARGVFEQAKSEITIRTERIEEIPAS